ncbi:MAG TPA: discoidin domain-containing protein, partial [Candidatus Solibacter sp.]|nr:discoidin domain-containing protein [Candidatus Solibacter sp.]
AFAGWRGARLPGLVLLTASAGVVVAPWIVRNWIWAGNPFAPFLNAWFPNPYYHAGMEKIYVDGLSHYEGIKHFWEIPLQLTMRGSLVAGVVGPAFLLAPLALLALRSRHGRQGCQQPARQCQARQRHARWLLTAALVFAVPAYFNTGTRFLIPALPFVALAMGLGLSQSPGVLWAVALFHAAVSWPAVLSTYCDHWAWRIPSIPVNAALRREPEWPYILARVGDLNLKGRIEQAVPPGETIFSFAGRPEAYIDRDIVVQYESTLGNLVQDILQAPDAHPPKHLQAFQFLPVTARGVRVVNLAAAANFWTVAEMRIRSQGGELARTPGWRVSAWPNGWEAPLAFDNSYTTRWSTWQAMSPGARLQAEFGKSETLDSVWLECDPAREAKVQVEVLTERGRWVAITDTAEHSTVDLPSGIRRAASRDVKALGIRFLWINDSDFCAADMKNYSKFWGITLLAEANGTRFYRID